MEKLVRKNVIFGLFFALVLSLTCAFGLFKISSAKAEQNPAVSLSPVLPQSKMELQELSSPIDAYSWENNIAIVQSGSLLLYVNNNFLTPIELTSPKQIKKLNDNSLIVSRNGSLCKVDLTGSTPSLTELKTSENFTVGGNDFDCNSSYIVSEYANDINIYAVNGDVISEPTTWRNQKDADTSICMNDKNEVFFVKGGKLFKCSINDKSAVTELATDSPTTMIAKDNFLYYVKGTSIIRLNTIDYTSKQFTLTSNDDYDLGNLSTPESISFKDQNLLIADSTIDAVQEFALNEENNSLSFTGFAVAKNKTAFNRIGSTAKDVDSNGNDIAVLDDFKLTIILGENKGYLNFLQEDIGHLERISFGEDKIFGYSNYNGNKLCLIDLSKTENNITIIDAQDKITDVAYRFGSFYYSTITPGLAQTTMNVFKSGETSNPTFNKIFEYPFDNGSNKEPIMTVTADNSVNVFNPASKEIECFASVDGIYVQQGKATLTADTLNELESDFANNLFGLENSAIVYSDGTNKFTSHLTVDGTTETNVTSFTLNENKKSAFFTVDGYEGLYKTDDLPNFSIDSIVTSDFKTTSNSADLNNLKICNVDKDWIYTVIPVEQDQTHHTYQTISVIQSISKEYIFVCSVDHTVTLGAFTKTINYSVLAGQDQKGQNALFIINTDFVGDATIITSTELTNSFVFTDVNMYYLPIISLENTYCLTEDNLAIRLNKGDEIIANESIGYLAKVTFLDKEFYYASAVIDGVTYTGYVPVNFTVEILDKDVVTKTYKIELVKKTIVKNANGNEIYALNKNSEVRVYAVKDGVATIEYFDGELWRQGYINNSDILHKDNTTIRNAIIIILMTASVLVTTAFLILRKKRS